METRNFYKNESYTYLFNVDGWLVAANNIEHLKGLFKNRSGNNLDIASVTTVGNNVTVIEKECDTYEEATGIPVNDSGTLKSIGKNQVQKIKAFNNDLNSARIKLTRDIVSEDIYTEGEFYIPNLGQPYFSLSQMFSIWEEMDSRIYREELHEYRNLGSPEEIESALKLASKRIIELEEILAEDKT